MRFGDEADATDQTVEPLDLGLEVDVGAPLPHLLQAEHRAFVAFYLSDVDPAWDGTWVNVVDSSSDHPALIGIIEWLRCGGAVLGGLNDEARAGHPLWSKGLDRVGYATAEVHNSRWIREWERANSVHPHHSPATFQRLRHVLVLFHDSTFECVAEGYIAYRTRDTMPSVLAELARRLVDAEPLGYEPVTSQLPR